MYPWDKWYKNLQPDFESAITSLKESEYSVINYTGSCKEHFHHAYSVTNIYFPPWYLFWKPLEFKNRTVHKIKELGDMIFNPLFCIEMDLINKDDDYDIIISEGEILSQISELTMEIGGQTMFKDVSNFTIFPDKEPGKWWVGGPNISYPIPMCHLSLHGVEYKIKFKKSAPCICVNRKVSFLYLNEKDRKEMGVNNWSIGKGVRIMCGMAGCVEHDTTEPVQIPDEKDSFYFLSKYS